MAAFGASALWLRPACEDDADDLARIYQEARRAAFWWANPGLFQRDDFYADTREEWVVVALSETGQRLGFLSLWEPESFIHCLYLDPEQRGRGIGGALLDYTTARGFASLSLKCLVRNEPAMRFYQRRGFVYEGERGVQAELGAWLRLRWDRPLPAR